MCTGRGAGRRKCLGQAALTLRTERHACKDFVRSCRTCCAADGAECAARCGDGVVTAARDESCDPPGAQCAGGGQCDDQCHCPPPGAATTTTLAPPATTTTVTSTTARSTTTPPTTVTSTTARSTTVPSTTVTSTTSTTNPAVLGRARFAVGNRTQWYGSSFTGFNLLEDSAAGALVLNAVADTPGDATLTLAVDGGFGVKFFGDGYLCAQVLAAASSGVLHCSASTAGVDASWTLDSNGPGPTLSSVVSVANGGPSPAGSGYLVVGMRTVSCGGSPAAPGLPRSAGVA